jgi:hypothetical protein
VDAGAKRLGDELRPQADPQHRLLVRDRPLDQPLLVRQPGEAAGVVDGHPAAENDEEGESVRRRDNVAAVGVRGVEVVAARLGPRRDCAGALGGGVLEDADAEGHGADRSPCSR